MDCENLAKAVKKELKNDIDYLWKLTEESGRERGYQVCLTDNDRLYTASLFVGDESNVVMQTPRYDKDGNELIDFLGLMDPDCHGDDAFLTNVHTHPGKRYPEKKVKTQLSGTDIYVTVRGGADSICVITEGDRLDCAVGLRRMEGEKGDTDRDVAWFHNVMAFEDHIKYGASREAIHELAKKKGAKYCSIKL